MGYKILWYDVFVLEMVFVGDFFCEVLICWICIRFVILILYDNYNLYKSFINWCLFVWF